MKRRWIVVSVLTLALFLAVTIGLGKAQGPELLGTLEVLNVAKVDDNINVQGRLMSGGSPVNGSVNVTFRLYGVSTAGAALWSQTKTVEASDGYFSTELNVVQTLFNGRPLWLSVQVAGDSEMSPRQKVLPVPYALGLVPGARTYGSELASTLTLSNTGMWGGESGDITYADRFDYLHGVRVYASGLFTWTDQYGIQSQDLGVGVHTYGKVAGIYAQSSGSSGYGGYFDSDGFGVYAKGYVAVSGIAGPTGTGVVGHSGYASSMSYSGVGVVGDSANGIGVVARSVSADDPALRVQNQNTGDLIQAYSGSGISSNLRFRVSNTGYVYADGTYNSPASDFAEMMKVEGDVADYEPGDVLVISDAEDGAVELSTAAYSSAVFGIYSTQPGFLGGAGSEGSIPVALVGVVDCKVSAENGPIQRGDLLTTSNTPGHAMRVTDRGAAIGAILGKALAPLESGTGVISVLVILQ